MSDVKRKTCRAKTVGGKECKNLAKEGTEYCWLHSLSRTENARWWEDSRIQALIIILAVVGVLATIYYGKTGATKEGQASIETKQDTNLQATLDTKAEMTSLKKLVKKQMGILDDENSVTWSNSYPLGYVLLTLTTNKEVIPFKETFTKNPIDWSTCSFSVIKNIIWVTLPDMTLSNGDKYLGIIIGVGRRYPYC
ncbi:MAG TPA: hypothetical protein VFE51_09635 [Verrucomicrobiae bacterium]|nr:hypothetical protein [Verrucomicrobiae bacterium]